MSNTNLIGQYSGIGAVPVGVIMPWVSGYFTASTNTGHTPVLASADTIAAANTYLNPLGYYVCDGSAVNVTGSPIWNAAGRYLPNLTDSRFLMGSTAISSTANGGSNVMADHKHANTNLSVVGEAVHTHGVGTYANTAEAVHTHGAGTYGNTAEASHTHNWGGNWSNDGATLYAAPYGDGTQNTYSDGIAGINAWGSGSYASRGTASDSGALAHAHSIRANNPGYAGDLPIGVGNGGGGDSSWYMIQDALIANAGQLYANSDNGSLAHGHTYYLPSHRHWIQVRTSAAGSSHNHPFSGTSGAGASHNHTFSGTSAAGSSHTHTLSGVIGSGSVDPVAGTIENRPLYMKCLMIIRVN